MNRLLTERSRDGKSVLGSMANMFGLTDANITELPIERLHENAKHPFRCERMRLLPLYPKVLRPTD